VIPSRFNEPHFNRILVGVLLIVFVAQCVAYNFALPLFEAPDEGAHYIYIDYIASHHQLPDLEHMLSHEESQTPLYYMIGAPMIAWIDRSDFSEVFRIEPGLNNGIVNAHSPKERAFPPTGVTLAMRILRLYSTVLGACVVVLVYVTAYTLFERRDVALVALALTAFNPKFLHMSSQFNNDIALACTAALCIWLAARMVKQPNPPTWKQWLALGASVGLAVAVKLSGFVMAATVAFPVVWWGVKAWRGERGTFPNVAKPGRARAVVLALRWCVWCVAGFAVSCGWLFIYYVARFGNPLPLFLQAHALGIRPEPLSLAEILARMPKALTSYWGEFGHGVQFPVIVDQVMLVVVALCAAGLVIAFVKRQLPREMMLLVVAFLAAFAAFIGWMRSQTGTENSRLLSPGFVAVSVFAAAGLLAWFPRRWRNVAALGITALSAAGGLSGLFLGLLPGYAMPVYLTDAQVSALPGSGSVQFDNGIELVSADLGATRLSPGDELAVSVYWRATQPITDVYRAVVELRDEQGGVLGRISTLPLAGRYDTTQMEVGRTFRDDYRVPVSATLRSLAHVYVGWYQHRSPNAISHVVGSGSDSAQVGLVKVRGTEPSEQAPETVFTSTFGMLGRLEGYTLQGDDLTLYWRSLASPAQDYTVFVHALDAAGQMIGQGDAPIAYPISLWDPGEQILDAHHVVGLGQAQTVSIGLYDAATGQRVSAYHPDGSPWPDDAVVIPLRNVPDAK
jgi:hypothetical protein